MAEEKNSCDVVLNRTMSKWIENRKPEFNTYVSYLESLIEDIRKFMLRFSEEHMRDEYYRFFVLRGDLEEALIIFRHFSSKLQEEIGGHEDIVEAHSIPKKVVDLKHSINIPLDLSLDGHRLSLLFESLYHRRKLVECSKQGHINCAKEDGFDPTVKCAVFDREIADIEMLAFILADGFNAHGIRRMYFSRKENKTSGSKKEKSPGTGEGA